MIDARLLAESDLIAGLALSDLRLMKDANYPWLLLIPRNNLFGGNYREIIDLSEENQLQLMREISFVSKKLQNLTKCDKLNVAALGNMVPQLHIHIIARFINDAAWPSLVFGKVPAIPYKNDTFLNQLKEVFS